MKKILQKSASLRFLLSAVKKNLIKKELLGFFNEKKFGIQIQNLF